METKTKRQIPEKTLQFPKLMVIKSDYLNAGVVVLFNRPQVGMVVSTDNGNGNGVTHKVGNSLNAWIMDHFEDFYGEVTLVQNK